MTPLPFDANLAIDLVLLMMLCVIAGAILRIRSLLAAIVLMGIYSLISAVWLVVMDAADVAFTEAVVGAGVSTIILLGAILLTRGEADRPRASALIAPGAVAIGVGGLLIYAVLGLPDLGDPVSPVNAHVGRAYLEAAPRDIGISNVVTAVLASYRGFDTLGETSVIFAAGLGVALMLGFGPRASPLPAPAASDDHHVVLRVTAKLLIPLMALYAFYVQFHGDLGPGGGFQAGVILAVAITLHGLVFGLSETMKALPPRLMRTIASLGVLIYAGVGVTCIINGGGFLDYDHLLPPQVEAQIPAWFMGQDGHEHHWGQHFGIMAIELGVLLTVAATMVTIFYGFAGRAADAVRAEGRR